MSLKETEAAITKLPAQEVAELMSWLAERHGQIWDKQIEDDLDAGRLDALLAEVEKGYEAGLAKPLWTTWPCPDFGSIIANCRRKCRN